jgi:PAS domain S-box-containing protein
MPLNLINEHFLAVDGELPRLIAEFPWETTQAGPIVTWPAEMKTCVGVLLRSPVPIVSLWYEQGVMIYNDAYSVFAGSRHPSLLGSKVREGWPEVADFNDNVMKVGLAGGTLSYQDQELVLHRDGRDGRAWMNLDYSPVIDADGKPFGVIAFVVETTGKVRAERWLSGERERLRRMFEQAPGFVAMLTGPDHRYELVNPAYTALVGTHRALLGHPARDVVPELADQGVIRRLDEVWATGMPHTDNALHLKLQRVPGGPEEACFLDIVYQPLRNTDGEVFGIFVQGADVTARVHAENALQEQEAQFRALAEAMPNHVWSASPDGLLTWSNERYLSYTGASRATLDGDGWLNRIHPDDRDAMLARWRESLSTHREFDAEYRICGVDGHYRWHLARAVPQSHEDGRVARWIGTHTDIESQKAGAWALTRLNAALEQQVAARTADFDRIWRLSTDLMLVAEFDGRIVNVNPAWRSVLGLEEVDLIGRSLLSLIHPQDIDATQAELGNLEGGATTMRFQNRYQTHDGGYRTLSWTAVPNEGLIHAIGRDVTADLEATAALRRTEVALQQAQKMETVGKLTGGVAHDFNNLLQVIAGNLQLLSRDVAGNERAERRVASALGGVHRGAKLASHLLAFGRRQVLEPRVVSVGRFLLNMEDMLRRTIGEAIDIETVAAGGLWNTLVDPAQLENAVLNLVINARDAMAGHGKLTVEASNAFLDAAYAEEHGEVTAGQYVLVAVTDTGTGMAPDVLARVFEPFFSTKSEGKGSGLGLSMVYGFVKQSGGHVKLYSEPGHGTTVKLYLPRTQQPEDVVAPPDVAPVSGGTETILVAEDDDEVRTTVVETLGELGYRVLRARDASSALSIIEGGVAIDLLFTDVVMPGPLRSPDLARRAKELLPELAVLFTSGYTENAIVHGGRLDAGVELLGKPYTREALARKVRHVLNNQRQRAVTADTMPARAHKPRLVLLVEDDELIRVTTAEMLRELGHTVHDVPDAEQALALLDQGPVDLLLTDLQLPTMSGLVLVGEARARHPDISVLVATGNDGGDGLPPGTAVLRKPYDGATLAMAVQKTVSRVEGGTTIGR